MSRALSSGAACQCATKTVDLRRNSTRAKRSSFPARTLYVSIGQCADWGNVLSGTKVETQNGRLVKTAEITWQTADADIFGGGDIATGPKYTIDAIANGREGATSIHRFVHPGHSLDDRAQSAQFQGA